jgi:hypothetical protein
MPMDHEQRPRQTANDKESGASPLNLDRRIMYAIEGNPLYRSDDGGGWSRSAASRAQGLA